MKNITLEGQMELTLAKTPPYARKPASRRARWWFTQMRTVVDRAMDWKPRPAPRSHQTYMALHREGPNW